MIKYSGGKLGVQHSMEKGMHVVALNDLISIKKSIVEVPCKMIISAGNTIISDLKYIDD
jgi:hypothetical protein